MLEQRPLYHSLDFLQRWAAVRVAQHKAMAEILVDTQTLKALQGDSQKLKESLADIQLLTVENLKLRARLIELETEVKRLQDMWEKDPTLKTARPLLDEEE